MSRDAGIAAVRTGVAWSEAPGTVLLRVTGDDPVAAFDRAFPLELFLRDGQVRPTVLLDDHARVIADVYVGRDDDALLVFAEGLDTAALLAHLDAARASGARAEVEVLSDTHEILSLHGPYAWELVGEVLGPDLIGLPFLAFYRVDDVLCLRGGKTGEYGYDLVVPKAGAAELRARLEHEGRAFDLTDASAEVIDQMMLENGFFNVLREGRAGLDPIALGLQWRVSSQKDAVGSAALAEARAAGVRRRVTTFVSDHCDRRGRDRSARWGAAWRGPRGGRVADDRSPCRPRADRRAVLSPRRRGAHRRRARTAPGDSHRQPARRQQPQPLRQRPAPRVRDPRHRRVPGDRMSASRPPRFEGRTVLVTGASRGLGRAMASAFGAEGAFVAIGFKSREKDAALALEEVRAAGGDGALFGFDVARRDEVDRAVARLLDARGAIDVLVNNAGIARDELFPILDPASWDEVLATNLGGAFALCRAVARPMITAKRGAIVNVAAVSALRGSPGQTAYAASKGGLLAFTRTLAAELAPRGVRVNAVVPGAIASGLAARLDHRVAEKIRGAIPAGRFGTADEVARAVLFLASDDASYVVGHALVVDGGLTA